MPVFKKIKAKAKSSRGSSHATDFVMKQFLDHIKEWDAALEDAEKNDPDVLTEIKTAFEKVDEDLGEIMIT